MELGIIGGYSSESLLHAKNLNLDFVEICCNYDKDSLAFTASGDIIKKNIAETGVPIRSVGRWNACCNAGGKIDEEAFKIITDQLDVAVNIGAKVFVCGCNRDENVSLYKNYGAAIELFGRLIDRAAGKIQIAAYNCDWNNFVYNDEQWRVVLGELPELKIKFDCSHAINREENYLGLLSDWGDRVAHVHIKGTTRIPGHRPVDDPPAGMDGTSWGDVFAILYARGYEGGLSIEPHSQTWFGERGEAGIKFTVDFIRRFVI